MASLSVSKSAGSDGQPKVGGWPKMTHKWKDKLGFDKMRDTQKWASQDNSQDSTSTEVTALRWIIDIGVVLLGAVIIAILLRMFVVQVYQIPSGSMENTLEVGSKIAVSRVPILGTQVERGDVVVFEDRLGWLPDSGSEGRSFPARVGEFLGILPAGGDPVLVKRIVGVEGDVVECCNANGNLSVNGIEVDEPYTAGVGPSASEPFKITVPKGSLWVMGDNRSNSADSLYHYLEGDPSFVNEKAVIGRAIWEIWPLNKWSYLGNRNVFSDIE